MNDTELTMGNIYFILNNLDSTKEDTEYGCDLIKRYIKKETNLSDDKVEMKIEGTKDSQITLELEPSSEYKVYVDGVTIGNIKTRYKN